MSLKNQKNLVVVGGVVVALVIGTVLLGGFATSEPAPPEASSQVTGCPAAGCGGCPMAQADSAAWVKASDSEAGCCPKPCPPDCPKPCCAKEAPTGCSGKAQPSACCGGAADAPTQ